MRTGHSRGEKTCIDVQSGDVGCWGHRVDREEDRAVAPTKRWGQQSLPVRLSLSPFSSLLGWFLSGRIFMGGLIRLGLDRRSGPV